MTRIAAGNVKLKRAYEAATPADGRRILIDRLWPRGVKKADAAIDLWLKDLSPSTGLRKWFGHEPARWEEFSGVIGPRSIVTRNSSLSCANWRKAIPSLWYIQPTTNSITMPLHSATSSLADSRKPTDTPGDSSTCH